MSSMTGSVQTAAHILSPFFEKGALHLALAQGGATALKEGQEVYVSASGQVQARTLGSQFPIGTISVGKGTGPKVTVATVFNRDMNGVAGPAPLAAGAFVRQDATLGANNEPTYVAAAPGEYALGIVLVAAAAGGAVRVGVLRSAIKL